MNICKSLQIQFQMQDKIYFYSRRETEKRFEKAKYYTEKYKDVLFPCKHCGNRKIVIASKRGLLGDNKVYWATPA